MSDESDRDPYLVPLDETEIDLSGGIVPDSEAREWDAIDQLLDQVELSAGFVPLCVRDSFSGQQNVSWCGRKIGDEDALETVDHAMYATSAGDVPCSKCMDVIRGVAILPFTSKAPHRPPRLAATYKDDLNIPEELKAELGRMSTILRPETFALIDPHNTSADLPRLLDALPTTLPIAVEGHVVAAQVVDWFAIYRMLHAEYLSEIMEGAKDLDLQPFQKDFFLSRLVALQIDGILTAASRLDLPFNDFVTGAVFGSFHSFRAAHPQEFSLSAKTESDFSQGRESLVRSSAQTMDEFMRLVVRLDPAHQGVAAPKKPVGRPKFVRLEFWNEINRIADTLTEVPTVGAFAEMIPSINREDRSKGEAQGGSTAYEKGLTAKRIQGRKRANLYARFKECKKAGLTNAHSVEEYLREKINTTVQ